MYGSPASKDLNQPPPPMNSSGLLRYRSAPSTLLGEVCEEFLQPGPRAASPDAAAADNVFSRFLADHQIRDTKPPPPPPVAPGAHFPDDSAMASQQHQQQMMFHSQQQHQQQMPPVGVEGLYRTVSSAGMDSAAAATAGGASSLLRQSSSPAGFLNHLNMDNGQYHSYSPPSFLNSAFFWYYPRFHSSY